MLMCISVLMFNSVLMFINVGFMGSVKLQFSGVQR